MRRYCGIFFFYITFKRDDLVQFTMVSQISRLTMQIIKEGAVLEIAASTVSWI